MKYRKLFYLVVMLLLHIGCSDRSPSIEEIPSPAPIKEIPRLSQIEEIFRQVSDGKIKVLGAKPLAGGFTADVYVVETDKKKYVIRFTNDAITKTCRLEGIAVARACHRTSLCPKIYWHSHEGEWMIMEWIESQGLPAKLTADQLDRIAQTIKGIVKIETPEKITCYGAPWYMEIAKQWLRSAEDHPDAIVITKSVKEALQQLERHSFFPEAIIHGDPWQNNLLMTEDGEIKVIDWDKAGIGNPMFDLSFFMIMVDPDILPEDYDDIDFLRAYLDKEPVEGEIAEYWLFKAITLAFKMDSFKNTMGFFGRDLLEELTALVKSDRFKNALILFKNLRK